MLVSLKGKKKQEEEGNLQMKFTNEGPYVSLKCFLSGPLQSQFADLWQDKTKSAYLIVIQELSWFELVFKD